VQSVDLGIYASWWTNLRTHMKRCVKALQILCLACAVI
jgi:hypothetical protein